MLLKSYLFLSEQSRRKTMTTNTAGKLTFGLMGMGERVS